MLNIVIWGAGKRCKIVLEAIKQDKCNIIGIVDSDRSLHQTYYMNKWKISDPKSMVNSYIDYIIISTQHSRGIPQQCELMGVAKDRIIDYWKEDEIFDFIDINIKKIFLLQEELKKYKLQLKNMPYELGLKVTPIIQPAEELLEIIINEKKSLSRFGDGELEIMQGRDGPWFQTKIKELTERLKEIFNSKDNRVIIALADNFNGLERYTEEAADAIRKYLNDGIREDLMSVIDLNRVYYDAYVTRPYIIYRDKKHAACIFELFKKVWENRNILVIEGKGAMIGMGNDLFDGASSIKRIIGPSQNAFLAYESILNAVKRNVSEDTLVLISLGPTATVLAYDLAMEGTQTLDIGQLDNEYEWFIHNAESRIEIPGKCVAELSWCHQPDGIVSEDYEAQIIEKIDIQGLIAVE